MIRSSSLRGSSSLGYIFKGIKARGEGGRLSLQEGEQLAAEMEIVVVCTEIEVVISVFECVFLSLLNVNG